MNDALKELQRKERKARETLRLAYCKLNETKAAIQAAEREVGIANDEVNRIVRAQEPLKRAPKLLKPNQRRWET